MTRDSWIILGVWTGALALCIAVWLLFAALVLWVVQGFLGLIAALVDAAVL